MWRSPMVLYCVFYLCGGACECTVYTPSPLGRLAGAVSEFLRRSIGRDGSAYNLGRQLDARDRGA